MAKFILRSKKTLVGILALIFAIIILLHFAELQQIALLLQRIRWNWFLVALAAQFAAFVFLASCYKLLLHKISFWNMFKTTLAMLFVDNAVPSFATSGNLLLYHAARRQGSGQGRASLLIALNIFFFSFFSVVFIVAGLIYLSISKQPVSDWILIITVLAIAAFTLLTTVLFTAVGNRWFKIVICRVLKKWPKIQKRAFKLLVSLYRARKEQLAKGRVATAFAFVIFVYAFRIAAISAVFLALGHIVNPGILVTGYMLTAFFMTISYIKVGIYEAAMTFAYSALGITYNVALAATLLYRVFAFWFPMVMGFICFRELMKK